MKNFKKQVVVRVLSIIEANEQYLCKMENLPQMAKLGYILEVLHRVYLVCYGDTGKIKKARYQSSIRDLMDDSDIEMDNDKIYDGWCMHLSESMIFPSFVDFKKLIYEGKALTENEALLIKPKKTFDEWVDVLTNKEYVYHKLYPNRRQVAASLLFFDRNEYVYCDGFIEGAVSWENLVSDYGDWQNAVLPEKICKQITRILEMPMVAEAFEVTFEVYEKRKTEKNESEKETDELRKLVEKTRVLLGEEGLLEKLDEKKRERDQYPTIIFGAKSPITQFTQQTHSSYIEAGIEMCKFVLANKKQYSKIGYYREGMFLPFCESFLTKHK